MSRVVTQHTDRLAASEIPALAPEKALLDIIDVYFAVAAADRTSVKLVCC